MQRPRTRIPYYCLQLRKVFNLINKPNTVRRVTWELHIQFGALLMCAHYTWITCTRTPSIQSERNQINIFSTTDIPNGTNVIHFAFHARHFLVVSVALSRLPRFLVPYRAASSFCSSKVSFQTIPHPE